MPRWISAIKDGLVPQSRKWVKDDAGKALRDFRDKDLRYSYLIIAAMIVIGLVINWLFAHSHGWTVGPFVLAAGTLLYTPEAAKPTGPGAPPLQVYALFGGGIAIWIILMAI